MVCLVIFGCGSHYDYETVDFSDTVESEQQQDVNGGADATGTPMYKMRGQEAWSAEKRCATGSGYWCHSGYMGVGFMRLTNENGFDHK